MQQGGLAQISILCPLLDYNSAAFCGWTAPPQHLRPLTKPANAKPETNGLCSIDACIWTMQPANDPADAPVSDLYIPTPPFLQDRSSSFLSVIFTTR